MYLISLLWQYTGELIRPKGSIEHLTLCLSFLLSLDNYNVNDWVLKETLLGRILNSACAALCTGESLQTLSRFLISSAQKVGPYYTALSESLIIIFVRAALFISRSVSSYCKLFSLHSKSLRCNPYCSWLALNLFFPSFSGSVFPFLSLCQALRATRIPDAVPAYLSYPFSQTN